MLITKRFYKTVKIAKRTKLPSDLVIFLIFSFDIPLDFHEFNIATEMFNVFFSWSKY